jgi:NADPH:quinone reductase-like Zn-dependent oxidoreductase
MRVAGIRTLSGPLETLDVADPRPLDRDEALIEMCTGGVGNWDEFVRTGGWDVGRAPPMALGVQGAGVVAAVGAGVHEWGPGDEVLTHPLPLREQGTWAPWLIAPAALLARKPGQVSWVQAAAFPVPALTAEQVLAEALEVKAGELVLVNGGGGVTGGMLVGLAAARGAKVVTVAGPADHDRLRAAGAEHVIDYHDGQWPEQVRAIGGGGVDAAANAVPKGSATAIGVVRDGGRLATITSDPPAAQRGIRVSSVYVRPDGSQLGALVELLGAGKVGLSVGRTFELGEAARALSTVVAGRGGGAVVLSLGDA